jgi:hypothetical protein
VKRASTASARAPTPRGRTLGSGEGDQGEGLRLGAGLGDLDGAVHREVGHHEDREVDRKGESSPEDPPPGRTKPQAPGGGGGGSGGVRRGSHQSAFQLTRSMVDWVKHVLRVP